MTDRRRRGRRPALAFLPAADALRGALLDSRQRWRDLVTLAADLAFETDADGRFVFVAPDPALGWPAASLLGQPAEQLLAEPAAPGGFNPFRPSAPIAPPPRLAEAAGRQRRLPELRRRPAARRGGRGRSARAASART